MAAWSELRPEEDCSPLDDASLMITDESADAMDSVPDWLLVAVADVAADGERHAAAARDETREIDEEI